MRIDFNDFEQLQSLMNRADEFPTMLMGENDSGEFMTTSICDDCIVCETLQKNGWTRKNIYRREGTTEEIYSK